MATIVKRKGKHGKIHYRVLVRKKNTPHASATFPTLSEAKKWASSQEGSPTLPVPTRTFAEFIDRYIAEVLPHKKSSTIPEQAQQLRWWEKQLGHLPLYGITRSVIAEHRDILRNGITKRHTRCSNATVVRYLAALSHAFTIAITEWQ